MARDGVTETDKQSTRFVAGFWDTPDHETGTMRETLSLARACCEMAYLFGSLTFPGVFGEITEWRKCNIATLLIVPNGVRCW
jgi:hypothetical protein